MNKIYKVVWSKVKHCYVVTSELAKRQTKGCGARSLRMATVSLGVAASLLCTGAVLPIFGESVAEAGSVGYENKLFMGDGLEWNGSTTAVTITADTIDTINNNINADPRKHAYGNITYTYGSEKFNAIAERDVVSFKVVDGQLIECHDAPITVIQQYPSAMDGYDTNKDVSGYSITINNTSDKLLYAVYGGYSKEGNVSSNSATITNGTITDSVYGGYTNGGKVSNNTVNLNGGTVHKVYGGYTTGGAAETNHVVMNGGVVGITTTGGKTVLSGGQLYGAYSYNSSGNSGNVTGNTVTINEGIVMSDIYGGSTKAEGTGNQSGVATKNIVTINDGTLAGRDIYGGYSGAQYKTSGNVEGNQVIIKGGVLKSASVTINGTNLNTDGVRYIYGGYTYGYDKDTDTNASGIAKDNVVTISGGALRSDVKVTGGESNANNAEHNMVNIESTFTGMVGEVTGGEAGGNGTAKKNEVTISGGTVRDSNDSGVHVFGGKASTGSAIENKVTINKNATVNSHVDGGYTTAGTAENNEVTIDGGNVNGVVNGGSISYEGDTTPGAVTGNTVTIKNGSKVGFQNASGIYGGYVAGGRSYGDLANAGDVTGNKVFIMGGEVYDVYGGLSELGTVTLGSKTLNSGDVTKNEVEISGGTVSGRVYGGWTNNGTAGGDTANDGNKVTIGSGTVEGTVYGGYSKSGDAKYNSVSISGNGQVNNTVYGGYSEKGAATGNTISIEGGTVKASVWGGQGTSSSGNKITMSGGIFSGLLMIGGMSTSGSGDGNTVTISGGTFSGSNSIVQGGIGNPGSLNNTVNLTGTVTGLENVGLFGGGDSDKYSGNDLHVGGTKDGTVTGVWQGKTGDTVNNKVKTIARFDKVVLHSVKWDKDVAALEATTVENVKTLDIKDLKFDKTPANGESMALLKSGSNLSAITLTYEGGANKTITPAGIIVKDGSGEQTEATGVNGVKLTTKGGSEKVSLPDVNTILYSFEAGKVKGITFGIFDLSKEARDLGGSVFEEGNTVDAADLSFADTASILKKNDSVTLVSNASGMATAVANNTGKTIAIKDYEDAQKIKYTATATGDVTSDGTAVKYTVSSVTLNSVDLGGWAGTTAAVPESWTAGDKSVTVNNADAITVTPTATQAILTAGSGMFADVNVAKEVAFDPVAQNGVTLSGTQTNVIKTTQTNVANDTIMYEIGKKKDVKSVVIATVAWDGDALDGSSEDYNYAGASVDHSGFAVSNPEKVEADTAMTLLKANDTLQNMAAETKQASYSYTPVTGVTVEGNITGTLKSSGGAVTYTPTANQASKLTFGSVEWKDSGALLTRPANVVFDGAKVVTTNIKFTNIDSQVADQTMTLVHKFDGTPSAIEGDHYMVGSGRMGEGAAEMNGNDLIFRTKTGTAPTEATHETVMAMEAGTAVVAAGREYVDSAVEGLGLISNMAPDGTSTFASMGGGVGRYKTGSHVDTHTWSAVVAVGSKREHKKGSLEWGVFAEYGRGNYTLHDDNGGRGDGDTHYAGGGLLAKWTNKHDVYAEASVRMGRMSDSASNMLTDRLGNSYGYDVHANYVGGHVGFGKIYKVQKTKDLDVYGKFFYTRRNGVDFDAGGNHYSLDSVNSSLLRVGARYGSNDRKWNWYGGLAYEYEFGGESKGTVDGLAIRSASIKGASVRGEIGMRMEATKTNPWKVDIGIFGYGGKHRGFGGSVNVAYMF